MGMNITAHLPHLAVSQRGGPEEGDPMARSLKGHFLVTERSRKNMSFGSPFSDPLWGTVGITIVDVQLAVRLAAAIFIECTAYVCFPRILTRETDRCSWR